MYVFLFLKNIIIYCLGPENYRIMLICELTLSLDSEWNNKIILPTPDNSVCFSLFWYVATSMNLRYAAKSILTMSSKGNLFKSVFSRFLKIGCKTCFLNVSFLFSHRCFHNHGSFHALSTLSNCANLHPNQFTRFRNNLQTDRRTNGWTNGRVENVMRPVSRDWRSA